MSLSSSVVVADTPATAAQYNNLRKDVLNRAGDYGTASGTDTYTVSLEAQITAYTTGMEMSILFTNANTGNCTLNVNGIGAKSIKTLLGYNPNAGVIAAGSIHTLKYDGTNVILQEPKQMTDFGDSSDGALSISSGTTTLALVNNYIEKNYSSISISGTALLTASGAVTNGGIVVLNCAGDFTMTAGNITLDAMGGVLGLGGTAAGAGTAGTNGNRIIRGLQRSAAITAGELDFGGFYKGYCGAGGTGGTGGNANAGANAGGTGGSAGAFLMIRVGGAINFSGGTISCKGANGGNGVSTGGAGSGGGGGGGGGGVIILYNNLISVAGTINVDGGNGGNGGVGTPGLGVGGAGGSGGGGFSNAGGGGAVNSSGGAGTSNAYGNGGSAGTSGGSGGGNNGGGGGGGGGAGFKIVGLYEKYRN